MDYNLSSYPYPSRRRVIMARRGMVCTGQPLAAQAGLRMLLQGGNAVDAALATAICLTVVEPDCNGLGSDAFALVWIKNRLYGLNGSGPAPALLTRDKVLAAGYTEMPQRGWIPVTVPGAVSAWAELHRRFGRLPFAKLFEPAIEYARDGFPVSPIAGKLWKAAENTFAPYRDDPAFAGFFSTFLPTGSAPEVGETVAFPDHARTLERLAQTGGEAFYRGELADKIDQFSRATGGYLRKEDLAGYRAQWVDPIRTDYRGYDVWEIPPNGHGITALMALNIMKGFHLEERETLDSYHKQIEAMKLAFSDARHYVADPRFMHARVEDLLSQDYADQRRSLIGDRALEPRWGKPFSGGTVYLCTADGEGNMVSFIQSNFRGFGSGMVIPGTGIALNDRGNNFSLDPSMDNCLAPGKKPYHTIIPGFLTKDGKAVGPFGVMGGFMQPQGHLQVILNTLDFHMNPQAALDAPRWQWIEGKKVEVEAQVDSAIIEGLRARGHEIVVKQDRSTFGRGQIIWRREDGTLVGATEGRTDGTVAAF